MRGQDVILLGALFVLLGACPARADVSGEAILKALVKKGILTQQEADAVRKEAGQPTTPAPAAGPGIADIRKAQTETADQVAALQSTLTRLQRTSISGYVQARAVFQKNATPYSNLFVRRARINLRHTGEAGRFALSFFSPRVDLAVSGYWGQQKMAALQTPPVPSLREDRKRWGVAANAYNVLGGTFRGEYIRARDLTANLGAGLPLGTAPAAAGYVQYAYPVGSDYTLVVRYDTFDPDTGNRLRLGGDGEQKTLGFAALRQIEDNIRLTLAWELPRLTLYNKTTKTTSHPRNDTLTLQGQYRF